MTPETITKLIEVNRQTLSGLDGLIRELTLTMRDADKAEVVKLNYVRDALLSQRNAIAETNKRLKGVELKPPTIIETPQSGGQDYYES